MNKARKRIVGLLTAVLMLLALIPGSAGAAVPTSGNLIITKFAMGDKSLAGPAGNGHVLTTDPAGTTRLDGIVFKIYKVDVSDGVYPQEPFTLNPTNAAPTTLSDGSTHAAFTLTPAATPSVTTGGTAPANGVAKALNLPQGVYLVVEQPDTRITEPSAPFLVAVPMTDPLATDQWMTDVYAYPKNEELTITKKVDMPSVNIGDTVTFTITAGIPSNLATTTGYRITDTIPAGLTFKSVDSVVASAKADMSTPLNMALTTDYTAVESPAGVVTVKFTDPDGLTKLEDTVADYRFVQVKLSATVNAGILDLLKHDTVTNSATIDFTNQYGDAYESDPATATVHTGTVTIKKVDEKGQPLTGAQFQIATSEANAKADHFLRKASDGSIVDYGETGYDTASPWIATSTTVGTDALASFAGVADYTGPDTAPVYNTYWVAETKAPAGYNMLTAPVAITFSAANGASADYTVTKAIANNKGFTLPLTGEKGILFFTGAGIVLVGAGILAVVLGRKRKVA